MSSPPISTRRREVAHRTTRARFLLSYRDSQGELRELAAIAGADGSTLVIDRSREGAREALLLAHLAADEPPENVRVVCHTYLEADPCDRGCRSVQREDWLTGPLENPPEHERWSFERQPAVIVDRGELSIVAVLGSGSLPALRWTLRTEKGSLPLSLREAIARCQSYEPLRTSTLHAVAAHQGDPEISVTVLRSELIRVLESPIVLNRRLRELVLQRVGSERASMSEIAIRCGRVKHDSRGNLSGETSWLGRRIGVLVESGQRSPTPWVHSDVLALIAREGLGISPREAEVD